MMICRCDPKVIRTRPPYVGRENRPHVRAAVVKVNGVEVSRHIILHCSRCGSTWRPLT